MLYLFLLISFASPLENVRRLEKNNIWRAMEHLITDYKVMQILVQIEYYAFASFCAEILSRPTGTKEKLNRRIEREREWTLDNRVMRREMRFSHFGVFASSVQKVSHLRCIHLQSYLRDLEPHIQDHCTESVVRRDLIHDRTHVSNQGRVDDGKIGLGSNVLFLVLITLFSVHKILNWNHKQKVTRHSLKDV